MLLKLAILLVFYNIVRLFLFFDSKDYTNAINVLNEILDLEYLMECFYVSIRLICSFTYAYLNIFGVDKNNVQIAFKNVKSRNLVLTGEFYTDILSVVFI